MDRFVEDMQKNIKLIKKELLVENIDDLKRLFKYRITNEYSAIKSNGERQWYRHPDLDKFSKQAYAEGKRFFYAKPVNENNPNGELILCEPEYEYVLKRPLTVDEVNNIWGNCNERKEGQITEEIER